MGFGGYGGRRRTESLQAAIIPRGLVATTAAMRRARFGEWSDQIIDLAKRFYGGRIPDHVHDLVADFTRRKPWVLPEEPSRATYTITLVFPNGRTITFDQEPEASS